MVYCYLLKGHKTMIALIHDAQRVKFEENQFKIIYQKFLNRNECLDSSDRKE